MGKYYSQALNTIILSIMNGDSGTELVQQKGVLHIWVKVGVSDLCIFFAESKRLAHLSCQVCPSGCNILAGAPKHHCLTNTLSIAGMSDTDIPPLDSQLDQQN